MSRMLMAVGVIVIAAFVYFQLRPRTTRSPNVPDVQAPDINDTAGKARGGANSLADWLGTIAPATWQMIGTLLAAGLVVYVFVKYKALRWIVVGAAIAWVVVMALV